jgi:hypothetical protein
LREKEKEKKRVRKREGGSEGWNVEGSEDERLGNQPFLFAHLSFQCLYPFF